MLHLSAGRSTLPRPAHHAHQPLATSSRVARRSSVKANVAMTFAPPPAQLQQPAVDRIGSDDASPGWAILKIAGTQHFVDEGATVAVQSNHLQVSEGGKVRWSHEVLAAKHPLSGQLYRGGPHVVVEGEVQDMFQGPSSSAELQLTKVLITRIHVEPPVTKQPQQQQQQQQQQH